MVPLACCLSIAGQFHYLFSGLYIFVTTHADVFLELFFLFIFYVMLFDFVYWNLQLNWHTLLIILHALLGYVYGMYFFFSAFFLWLLFCIKKKATQGKPLDTQMIYIYQSCPTCQRIGISVHPVLKFTQLCQPVPHCLVGQEMEVFSETQFSGTGLVPLSTCGKWEEKWLRNLSFFVTLLLSVSFFVTTFCFALLHSELCCTEKITRYGSIHTSLCITMWRVCGVVQWDHHTVHPFFLFCFNKL